MQLFDLTCTHTSSTRNGLKKRETSWCQYSEQECDDSYIVAIIILIIDMILYTRCIDDIGNTLSNTLLAHCSHTANR